MSTVEYQGRTFQVDDEGFLCDFNDWNEIWAEYASLDEDIELTNEHWRVIKALQEYYKTNGIPPMVRLISRVTGFPLKYIYELFPSGPGRGACKIAGLGKPHGCI
jgi:tRNA 2-thiouridine synthesizing protein E